MRRFVLYDTYRESRGRVDERLVRVITKRHTEEELEEYIALVKKDPTVPYRNLGVLDPSRYTMRGLRLPNDKQARDWLLSLSINELTSWAGKESHRAYFVLSKFKHYENIDYCAGTFARIDAAKKVMDPGDRLVFGILKRREPFFFLSEEPSDVDANDMWELEINE